MSSPPSVPVVLARDLLAQRVEQGADRPLDALSATLPVKPSVTRTSAAPSRTSRPSALPRKSRSDAASSSCASSVSRLPFSGSSPIERRRTSGAAMPRISSAKTAPIVANWSRCSGAAVRVRAGVDQDRRAVAASGSGRRSPGRRTPGNAPQQDEARREHRPVLPADTTASASPSATALTARDERAVVLRAEASAGFSSMPTTCVVGTSSRPRVSRSAEPKTTGTIRRTRASSAPVDHGLGTAVAAHRVDGDPDHARSLRSVNAERLDLAALVGAAGRADAVRALRLAAGRADVDLRRADRVRRTPLVAARLGGFPLRNRHERRPTIAYAESLLELFDEQMRRRDRAGRLLRRQRLERGALAARRRRASSRSSRGCASCRAGSSGSTTRTTAPSCGSGCSRRGSSRRTRRRSSSPRQPRSRLRRPTSSFGRTSRRSSSSRSASSAAATAPVSRRRPSPWSPASTGSRSRAGASTSMPGVEFAGLFGGVTLPEFRGRGLYRATVARRAELARERGYRWLYVDALPTSRPILERLGFVATHDDDAVRHSSRSSLRAAQRGSIVSSTCSCGSALRSLPQTGTEAGAVGAAEDLVRAARARSRRAPRPRGRAGRPRGTQSAPRRSPASWPRTRVGGAGAPARRPAGSGSTGPASETSNASSRTVPLEARVTASSAGAGFGRGS